ncbi:ATP-binding protein [Streptomyces sp. NPDC101151]|uniref:ATP-binding protein n=1 Tax=Streptomyces sp. NPDC101151 TaxID=3366115 RepID=UPI0037FB9E86
MRTPAPPGCRSSPPPIFPRSLILTSSRAPSDWYPLFPSPVVAESLLDRLINTSHQVIMNGPSHRPDKRPRGEGADRTNRPSIN